MERRVAGIFVGQRIERPRLTLHPFRLSVVEAHRTPLPMPFDFAQGERRMAIAFLPKLLGEGDRAQSVVEGHGRSIAAPPPPLARCPLPE